MQTPLIEARMAVSNLGYGTSKPGSDVPTSESVCLQAEASIASKAVPNGNLTITIADASMMKKLVLGKTYKVLIVEDDGA